MSKNPHLYTDGISSYFCCAGTSSKTLCHACSNIHQPLRFHIKCAQRKYKRIQCNKHCRVMTFTYFKVRMGSAGPQDLIRFQWSWMMCMHQKKTFLKQQLFRFPCIARTKKIHCHHHRMQTCTHSGVPMFSAGPQDLIHSQGPWMMLVQ